jgi:hypothetical protein
MPSTIWQDENGVEVDVSALVEGGDVLIVGEAESGKTVFAHGLARLLTGAGRCVTVADRSGVWRKMRIVPDGNRVVEWRGLFWAMYGNMRSKVEIFDYSMWPHPGFVEGMYLGNYDDLIVDSWNTFKLPATWKGSSGRRILVSQRIGSDFDLNDWQHVVAFRLCDAGSQEILERMVPGSSIFVGSLVRGTCVCFSRMWKYMMSPAAAAVVESGVAK